MLKNAGILFAITLLAGIALGFVYELTKEPIAHQQELKVQRACAEVFSQAAAFKEVNPMELPSALGSGLQIAVAEQHNAEMGTEVGEVYRALSQDGSLMGYVLKVTTKEGYGGNIELMVGITMEGSISGISILSISETPGLGMQAGDVLVPQFAGRTAEAFVYTKTGAAAENEIDAISGATITTRAVTNAVNAGLFYFEVLLKGGI
ncbi:MAG: RnfABCDGE type electron transport complex subunit G [Lachnospiraceae bacterium]|nr:RnfABCDGE type electron transport complex subunit G [Lachnospiraceae bacterium]